MPEIRVPVSGDAGRVGRGAPRALVRETDLRLVAALGRRQHIGRDAGEIAGAGTLGLLISADLPAVFAASPDVLVEFAPGAPAVEHARAALERGVRPVVGSTGVPLEE